MSPRSESLEGRAAEQLAATVRQRLPRALWFLVFTFTMVAVCEVWAYPERLWTLLLCYPASMVLLAAGTMVAVRPSTPPHHVIRIMVVCLVVFILAITGYFILVHGHAELLALGLLYLVVGATIALPWGAGPQGAVVGAAIAGYCIATLVGMPSATPRSIHFVGMISISALSIASARMLARFHLDLMRRDEEKNALLEIARDLTGNVELEEVFERVQRRTARLLGCDIVATYFFDATARLFRMQSQWGLPGELLEQARSVTVPEDESVLGPARDFLKGAKTVVLNDVRSHPYLDRQLMATYSVESLMVAPLFLRDKTLGLFAAVRRHAEAFTAAQVDVFDSIARQLSLAMEAAEHYRQQQEEIEVAAALARVGRELISALDTPVLLERLCRVSAEVLHCDSTHAFLVDESNGDFVIRTGHGDTPERWEKLHALRVPASEVDSRTQGFREGDVVLVGRPSPHPQRPPLPEEYGTSVALCVALRRSDTVAGMLSAGRRGSTPFTSREQRVAGGISQLASLALENARLVEELDGANRVKSDFVANMSHELRTPLNVIIGYNDLLAEEAFGGLAGEQRDIVDRIGKRARELLELVNVTLDLSRVEAGDVPLLRRELNVLQLLRDLEMESHLMRVKPQVVMRWEAPPNLPPINTDAAKLRVVVRNIIANAIKFTDEGQILVSATVNDGGIEIAVADSGIGIPAEMREAIFEPFRQVDATPGRSGGVGLGLHLVRRLLDMLGGRITVESELGRGSTFRIWMPRTTDPKGATDEHR